MKSVQRSALGVLAAVFALVVLPGQALAGNATNINVTLPVANVAINGKISKHGDGAVSGALVELLKSGDTFPSAIAITDSNGNYAFYNTPNGQYILAVNPHSSAPAYMPGYYRQPGSADHFTTVQSSATKLNYSGTKLAAINVKVQLGHSISGKIKAAASNLPIKGISVSANLDASSGTSPFGSTTALTNASGDYVIAGLPNAKYSIRADPNANFFSTSRLNFLAGCFKNLPTHNYTANCASPSLITVNNANVGNTNMDLPYGHRITGAIKDAQGHNLCANVTATDSSFSIFPPTTTACGRFSLEGLESGDYTVSFRQASPSHFVSGLYIATGNHWVETGTAGSTVHIANADKDLGTIKPAKGHTISGTIKTAGGEGIKNVTVSLHGTTSGSYDGVSTNAQGKFTFFGVGSGTHTVQESRGTSTKNIRSGYYKAGGNGFTADVNQATALSNANHSGIVIKPPAGYIISGKIQNAAHQGILTFVSISGGPTFAFVATNAQGLYQFVGLDPGNYTLSVSSAKAGSTTYRGGYYKNAPPNNYTPTFGGGSPIHVGP